ncbi:MAG: hypothetical protein U0768_08490 [Anaerolineae bacterium]
MISPPFVVASIVCVILVLLAVAAFFNPSSVKRRQLSHLARQHFQNSRGTAHLRLMREAEARLQMELGACNSELARLTNDLANLDREEEGELSRKLQRYLVRTRLTEVRGVGEAIRDQILSHVFQGNLTDLYAANSISGVGETRQQAINAWVQHYVALLPTLRQSDFTGKSAILSRFAERRGEVQEQLTQSSTRRDEIQDQLGRLHGETEKLARVTERDFHAALLGQKAPSADLDAFNGGVFAEWEAMPDWFRRIVLEEAA